MIDHGAGHGEKQSRKKEQALAALLESSTVEAAAKRAGIGVATLYRWLREPKFKESYREARSAVLESAIAHLQQITSDAVVTLKRNLKAKQAFAQITAARLILDYALRGQELLDLGERVEKLEALLSERSSK